VTDETDHFRLADKPGYDAIFVNTSAFPVTNMSATHYVALEKGSVVPASQQDNPISNHLNTWRIAYTIEGIRAWLFEQRL
jgi:predicted peptidase